jgi:8-oxo-dGTP diphosphatase
MSHSHAGFPTWPLLVVAGLIEREGRFLIAQRPPGDWMEGYWEFPGGKLNPGEDPREGLEREIQEELSIRVTAGDVEEVLLHHYPDRSVLLLFFWCEAIEGEPSGCLGQNLEWITPESMKKLKFLPADWPLVERLASQDSLLDTGQQ